MDTSGRIFGKRLTPDTIDAFAERVAQDPSIIDKVMGKLAQGTGDVKLAAFLSKLFGDDFDLKAAAALIDTLKKDPAALDKMKAAADKQRAKKQPAEMKKLGFGYDLAADCALWN